MLSSFFLDNFKVFSLTKGIDINYISHPESDFAIFTTNELSNKPKYPLYPGSLNDLVSKSVTSVGFGKTLLDNTEEPYTRHQAFDSIIESVQYKELDSAVFKPDLNRTLEDTPIGITTSGDSGGGLLIKDNGEYKLVGVVKGTFGFIKPDIYESTPESLKSNPHNQDCIQKIETLSWRSLMELQDPCYGQVNTWTLIDLPFINMVKQDLLSRKGVYAYPSEIKSGYPAITFSLANELLNNSHSEKEKNFIGYASKRSQLNILIDGETFLTIPVQLAHSYFVYQQGDKHYPIEVTVEEALDGKNFLAKAIMLNEENDRGLVHNLINTLSRTLRSLIDYLSTDDNESHDAIASLSRPIYYYYPLDSDLPLKVSLNKCLSKNNFWLPEENYRGMELLGYSAARVRSFEVIIKLAGQEIKRFTVSDIFLSEEFECQYDGKSHYIELSVTNTGEKTDIVLFHKPIVAPPKQADNTLDLLQTTHAESSPAPVYFVRSCGTVSGSHVDLQLVEGVESKNSYYAKEGTNLKLTIADEELAYWPINKEGTYRTIYKGDDAMLYTIEVTVQKIDFPKTHYKIDLSIEKLDKN